MSKSVSAQNAADIPTAYRDCFGCDNERKRCKIFTEMFCATRGRCTHYKTEIEFKENARNARMLAIKKGY